MAFRRTVRDVGRVADRADGDDGPGDLARLVVDEISWYMREHKVSRTELAEAMGVSLGRVSQILSGDGNLTLRTVASVFAALGAQVDLTLLPVDERGEVLARSGDPAPDDDSVALVTGSASGDQPWPGSR